MDMCDPDCQSGISLCQSIKEIKLKPKTEKPLSNSFISAVMWNDVQCVTYG